MNMCTVKEIREAIREDYSSQHDMETTEIDQIFQNLPFSQEQEPLAPPRSQKPPFWFYAKRYKSF